MRRNIFIFVLLTIVMVLSMVACAQESPKGHIMLQQIYYETKSGSSFNDEDLLDIDHFELNGTSFKKLPYNILNLPGNKNFSYTINAYDGTGTLMASGSGQWMVLADLITTETATLTVLHLHTFNNTWTGNANYHWHASSCGHLIVNSLGTHTFTSGSCACTVCGYEKHYFGADTVVTEPSCTSTGTGKRTCYVCGKEETFTIPIKHSFVNGVCSICHVIEHPYIGPSGGYVFYDKGVYSDGWRYLEAAPADLSLVNGTPSVDSSLTGSVYFYSGFFRLSDSSDELYVNGTTKYKATNCTKTAVGTGKSNTQLLVDAMGENAYKYPHGGSDNTAKISNYAAKACYVLTYTVNGVTFDDWFLPSKDELNLMYTSLYKQNLGGFADDDIYWTSSEDDINPSYFCSQRFYSEKEYPTYYYHDDMIYKKRVRAIRAF